MWLIKVLKVTKNQGLILSLENTCLEKPQERESGKVGTISPHPRPRLFRVKIEKTKEP